MYADGFYKYCGVWEMIETDKVKFWDRTNQKCPAPNRLEHSECASTQMMYRAAFFLLESAWKRDQWNSMVGVVLNVHGRSVSESACCFLSLGTICMWDTGCLRVWPEKNLSPSRHFHRALKCQQHTHDLDTEMDQILSMAPPTTCALGRVHLCQLDHTTMQGVVWLASFCGKLVVVL